MQAVMLVLCLSYQMSLKGLCVRGCAVQILQPPVTRGLTEELFRHISEPLFISIFDMTPLWGIGPSQLKV
jgi:hypothetical protein